MANNLNLDLHGKVVILTKEAYSIPDRRFLCLNGFGCASYTSGHAVSGVFLCDGEQCRVEGYEVEALCDSQEVPEQYRERQAKALEMGVKLKQFHDSRMKE